MKWKKQRAQRYIYFFKLTGTPNGTSIEGFFVVLTPFFTKRRTFMTDLMAFRAKIFDS